MRSGKLGLMEAGVALMVLACVFAAVVVAVVILREEPERVAASEVKTSTPLAPLARTDYPEPPPVEKAEAPPEPEPKPEPEPEPEPEPSPEPRPKPAPEPEPGPVQGEGNDWPVPSQGQVAAASRPRHYELPPGAIMGLTINALDLHNVPVFNSSAKWALDNGVSHEPGTSMPWSLSEQKNVYLQGHRIGWPGKESHLVFYHLNKLAKGDEILLKDRDGKRYTYRVSEAFVVEPNDSWVMGRVKGRDMVTLQTCTPIPRYDKRLIVRANRV
jgi:sortase A